MDYPTLEQGLRDLRKWLERRLAGVAQTTDWPAGGGANALRVVQAAQEAVGRLRGLDK